MPLHLLMFLLCTPQGGTIAETLSPTKIIRRNFADGDLKGRRRRYNTETQTKAKYLRILALCLLKGFKPLFRGRRLFPRSISLRHRGTHASPCGNLGRDKCADAQGLLKPETYYAVSPTEPPTAGTAIFGRRTKKTKIEIFCFFVVGACAPAKVKPH